MRCIAASLLLFAAATNALAPVASIMGKSKKVRETLDAEEANIGAPAPMDVEEPSPAPAPAPPRPKRRVSPPRQPPPAKRRRAAEPSSPRTRTFFELRRLSEESGGRGVQYD